MIIVLLLMLAGILAGFALRQKSIVLKINEKLTSAAIYILLFLLGISVGLNKTIIQQLDKIGIQALIITIGAISGSVLTLWILYRFFLKDLKPGSEHYEE